MLRLSDSRNFSRTFATLGLVLGPLLFLLSTLFAPAFAVAPEDANVYLDRVAASPAAHLSAAALVLLGVVALPGFYLLQVVELAMTDPSAERAQMVALYGRIDEGAGGTVFFAVFGAGIVPGLLLLALVLFLRRAVPAWGPVALALSVVVGFLPDDRAASAVEFALLLVGTASIAWRILGLSDEEWERWQPLPERRPG